jgi:fibronectin-binding autotransporter adhesin
MKVRSRIACISAAVAAFMYGAGSVQATDLTWDADPVTPAVQDGSGNWDTATANWFDGTNNVTWSNATPDSALFGNTTSTSAAGAPNSIEFPEPITVQNLSIGLGTNGQTYNFSDFNGGSLTLAGNISKVSGFGNPQFLMLNGIALMSGDHTFALKDTGGDAAPELTINAALHGAGNVIVDTGASNDAYGTLAFNVDGDYTGTTTISKGRLVITTAGALGTTSAGTTISNQGRLSIGGAGTTVTGGLNISEPITITRDTYGTVASDIGNAALIFNNNGPTQTHTLSGPLVVNSADARISVNTNTLVIPTNIGVGPDVTTGVLSFTGDFAGYVQLTGDNSALVGGIKLVSAVEVQVTSQANLGGASAPIQFTGDATLGIMNGFMTDFGTHVVNYSSFSGGLDIPTTYTFNLTTPITGGAGMGKRGGGTLNFNASVTATTTPGGVFWDAGTVNLNANVSLGSLHLRSPVVNINNGATLTTTSAYSSFGQDGPDSATVNVNSGGKIVMANQDFNISDNANSTGVVNVNNGGVVSAAGATYLGKSANTSGTINLSGNGSWTNGGAMNVGRNVATGVGYINISDTATLTDSGSSYIGQLLGVGTVTVNNGTMNMVGRGSIGFQTGTGTLIQHGGLIAAQGTGGNSFNLGDANGGTPTVTTTGTFTKDGGNTTVAGETWIGNAGSTAAIPFAVGTETMSGGTMTVNNWLAIGRGGALGTFNLSGGTFTKQGSNNAYIGESTNTNTSTMTVSGTGSYVGSTGEFWVGQGGGKGVLNVQGGSFVTNNWLAVGRAAAGSNGTINLSGGTLTKQGSNFFVIGSGGTGVVNQTGGTLSSNNTRVGEASSGTANLSGGTATFTGEFTLGLNSAVFGTLNVSNTANVTVPDVVFGKNAGSGGGTLNLDGGTLTANSFANGAGTGAKVFNFNGGTLKANVDTATFMSGVTANVKNGGAIINSNGHNITIAAALVANGTGGLTKNGLGSVTLSGANTYIGGTVVSAGSMLITQDLRKSASLTVANSAKTVMTARVANVRKVMQVGTLNLNTTGTLDLNDNDLVVDNGVFSDVQAKVFAGYGTTPDTNLTGITSTVGQNTGGVAILALFNNALFGVTDYPFGSGQTIGANAIVGKYTYIGDTDWNGEVNSQDYTAVDANLGTTGIDLGAAWFSGDTNFDGNIDPNDYTGIDAALGLGAGNPLSAQGLAAVPEPASIGLVFAAAAGMLSRRRRK